MDHLEAIVEIKKILPEEFNKLLVPLIDKKAVKDLAVAANPNNENIRSVKGHHLSFDTPTDMFYWNLIKMQIERMHPFYKSKFKQITSDKVNQIDLLKYSVGGKYDIHVDNCYLNTRTLSVIINLNDDYEGGDLLFFNQEGKEIKRLKLERNSIVFFPSNFMYPHMIEPITKGTRYSIVAWLQ